MRYRFSTLNGLLLFATLLRRQPDQIDVVVIEEAKGRPAETGTEASPDAYSEVSLGTANFAEQEQWAASMAETATSDASACIARCTGFSAMEVMKASSRDPAFSEQPRRLRNRKP